MEVFIILNPEKKGRSIRLVFVLSARIPLILTYLVPKTIPSDFIIYTQIVYKWTRVVALRKQPLRPIAEISVQRGSGNCLFVIKISSWKNGICSAKQTYSPGKFVSVRRTDIPSWKIDFCSVNT